LQGSESAALETLSDICSHVEPFEASLGEMETFIPATPTVFYPRLPFGTAPARTPRPIQYRWLAMKEEWPYMPHMTIIKVPTEEQAQKAYLKARKRWIVSASREPSRSKN